MIFFFKKKPINYSQFIGRTDKYDEANNFFFWFRAKEIKNEVLI